jgi:hypothetical protein
MVRFCAGGCVAGGLRHGVPQIVDIVGKVGWLARAGSRVVLAQVNSWSDGDLREGRTTAWMDGFLTA